MPAFAAATLLPLVLIAVAALAGGGWTLAAFLWMAGLTVALDRLAGLAASGEGEDREFPAADGLSVLLALGHLVLLWLCVRALAGPDLGAWGKGLLFAAAGLWFGQVSNSNAHELIHRSSRRLRRLGVLVYVTLLFGHHASAHPLVHHVGVATADDPNSARLGESFYRFAPRAWAGSFAAGLRAESARLARAGRPGWRHPYLVYVGGALLALAISAALAGPGGVLAHLLLAAHAQMQLLLSDYVQHYGLRRALRPDGRAEPVGPGHSWNSPHRASAALMLNASRHSDHHARPGRAYPGLGLPAEAPMLPRGLPAMATLALWPRGWRRVMDRRVRALSQP